MASRVVFLALAWLGTAATAAETGDWLGLLSSRAPEGALIRRAEAVGDRAGRETMVVTRQYRELVSMGAVLIEGQAAYKGQGAAGSGEVPVLEMSFRGLGGREDALFQRLSYRTDTWYGSTFWSGPDWTRVGKDWQHPGENTPSVRCFRAPREGRVRISGRVYKLHKGGDGVRLMILHGDRPVWQAEIGGTEDKGVEPHVTLDVRKGDVIRFVVHKRGRITCDTTHWDPTVAYADGEPFQASKAFSEKQGNRDWLYEMMGGKEARLSGPMVYGLRPDLSLIGSAVEAGRSLALHREGALPFCLIADGADGSGVVLATDPAEPWSFRSNVGDDGVMRVTVAVKGDRQPGSGGAFRLPRVIVGAYEGAWTAGLLMLRPLSEAGGFAARVEAAYRRLAGPFAQPPDLDLLLVAQSEWRREDAIVETADSYTAGITRHLEAARSLLDDSAKEQPSAQAARLERMAEAVKRAGPRIEDLRALYLQVRLLKRDVLLASSALDLGEVLFCKRSPPTWSHLVAQYFGWRQQSGGGLYVLEKPGRSLRTRDIVGMQLPPGSFLAPCLSFDARRIVFSFVACTEKERDPREFTVNEEGPDEAYFHIYEVGVDGAGLRQLTHGPYDDLMPAYLPDGGIAFCSTRRRAYSRCFGPEYSKRWHSYTIHRMEGDGKNIRILSVNDVSEWFPCVSNTGHLLFARWDYIDRDAVTHQNLWAMRPDGTNQMAVWGNATPRPHCMFQARQIPNSRKIVFVASAHHAVTGGPVCILDPAVDANSRPEAVTRVTPQPFPEAEGSPKEYYEAVWPLSERLFLASYSFKPLVFQGGRYNPRNALGIYLLDAGGNRELLYRDPKISSTTPIPLSARPAPPALPGTPPSDSPAEGEMILTDIYRGLGDVPRGSIKDLRIVQIFPKTTYVANSPRIGVAGEENARMILGVVPVEADGSARFLLPAQRPVLFQALDKDGFAYQTMRSTTSVQSGERTSCVGCHESRASAPPNGPAMALQRPPSTIEPSELGGEAFSYMRVVQPVLDKRCAPCHSGPKAKKGVDLTGTPERGFTRSYWSLCGDPADFPKSLAAGTALVPRFVQRNQVQVTPPGGRYGALGSRLMKMLRDGHNHVKLSDSEVRRLAAWIDCNAVFYGAYDPAAQAEQLAGKAIPAPKIQ